jgi:hypothetical protein
VLVVGLLVFKEDKTCVLSCALGRSGHILQNPPRNIDIMFDLISD